MWKAVGLYSAYKRGSTQGAEGMSVPNLNQPCYKIEVWCRLYNGPATAQSVRPLLLEVLVVYQYTGLYCHTHNRMKT